ncbi:DUF2339 domain-containing protein [Jinshanibacter sp. LJY008]|uniref:DUF2339 domain-containing protein n=1 Tax=Limnobaculum eriocheiris TaxID=2897391 RepID=A0A9X1MZD5_9GAMM|nr:DUF2339 domain-containing protein [Limnobaculum eriocheiris]MCD1127420.1 DUF2339 domain-containing protein [Limnobaculum eriocheiris]
MDELIFLGLIILIAVLASPIMALVAMSRSRNARDEVSQLKKQVESLQKQLNQLEDIPVRRSGAQETKVEPAISQKLPEQVIPPVADEPVPLAPPAMAAKSDLEPVNLPPKPAEPVPAISVSVVKPATDQSSSVSVATAKAVVTPKPVLPQTQPKPPVQQNEGSDIFSGIISWLVKGNPVAKLGILLLFFGIAYLLKYTIERDMFPIELRLASSALISVVLLALGWRLRHKQSLYALILQGGAVGALYLTVFAAFRIYQLLPHTFAFVLMLVICAASVALAVLQRALSLAMLASIGGYLSPILLSTGSANHIGLFSYYLLISSGILFISIWQSWRVLNLLGFVFTFGVAIMWGVEHYQPEDYLSCQLFLIANLVLFSLLAELFAVKNRLQQHMAVDGTLLFGPPLIGFALQYAMTEQWQFGPAFSALGFGLIYLVITWGTLRRFPQEGKRIALGYLALGGSFVTLAIPLALSAQWTALAWAVEGLGILWFGLLQHQRRLSWSGSALLVLALGAQLVAYQDYRWDISLLFVLPVLFLCFIAGGALWRHFKPESDAWKEIGLAMLAVGIVLWCWWLMELPLRFYTRTYSLEPMLLALSGLSISVWIWRLAGNRLIWPELKQSVWLLWPAAVMALFLQLSDDPLPTALGWWNLVWLLVVATALFLLYRDAPQLLKGNAEKLAHLALFWLVLIWLGSEVYWRMAQIAWGMNEWRFYLQMCSLSLVILLLWVADRRQYWPVKAHANVYWLGTIPLMAAAGVMLLTGNMMDGQMVNWRYIPLVNPLEEAAMFGILMLVIWLRRISVILKPHAIQLDAIIPLVGWGLAFWWFNGILLRVLAYYADIAWWFDALWASRMIHTTFAIVWTLIALICMVFSARTGRRVIWFIGAALLGVVILKLFLVDSAKGGGLARAIAFLGVAVLLLVVGYFSPLPPRQPLKQEPKT